MKKILAVLLAAVMVFSLAACGSSSKKEDDTPLVVGYSAFNEKFSPFFAETAYDQDVASMTQAGLLTSDRTGAVILKGIEGETVAYNGTDYTYYGPADCEIVENADGTVDYNFTLKEGLKFSDGDDLTIDDVIFTMYVLSDPTYDGSSTFFALPIEGMEEYRSGMEMLFDLIYAAGRDNTDFTYWTEEQQKSFWNDIDNIDKDTFIQEIFDYLIGYGYGDENSDSSELIAYWGFEVPEGSTKEEVYDIMLEAYDGDVVDMISTESASSSIGSLMPNYENYLVGISTGSSASNISGIKKTGDNTLTVKLTKVDATAIYQLGVSITPLHYYGSADSYDYDNNQFGFTKGDLSSVRAKTTKPMGAGPYKFLDYKDGVVYFEANENYFKGAPKTKYINFQQCLSDDDKLNGVTTGTIDITDPSFSKEKAEAISNANSNGEITGDVITTSLVDNLGYGYTGLNANRIKVGDDPASEESKSLRKAIATVFAVYRDMSVESYYGDAASVINYPISNTSWAAPQATDEGYKVAFSVDVDGNDIYTSSMTADEKYAAAKEAALGFFEKAGYTVSGGKLTAAPEGASLEYELLIPGDGAGDHPSFMMVTEAAKAFETIGMNLIVTDLSNSSELWDGLDANQVDMWAAAWGASVDPDMYQIYYSDVANGGAAAGGSNYMYSIADPELDTLIMDARSSLDQSYRKAVYKECLDIIIDWAVEMPVYQRQNAVIFSTERVNLDTVTPDITTFYGWMSEIENTELN